MQLKLRNQSSSWLVQDPSDSGQAGMTDPVVHKRGSVLVYALILTAMLLSSALSLATLAAYGSQTSRRLIDSVPAYYAAESCLEELINRYIGKAAAEHLYIEGDSSIPSGTGNDPVTGQRPVTINLTSTGAFGIAAGCVTSGSQNDRNAVGTIGPTRSVTITSYGTFGKSTEGLSATITR